MLNSLVYLYLRISCFRLHSKVMFSVDVGLQVVFFQYFENVLLSLTSMAFSWEIYFHSVCFPSYVHWLFFLNHILSSFTLDFRRCTVICIHIIILGFYLWVASANWFDILSLKIWMYLIAVWTHCQPFTLCCPGTLKYSRLDILLLLSSCNSLDFFFFGTCCCMYGLASTDQFSNSCILSSVLPYCYWAHILNFCLFVIAVFDSKISKGVISMPSVCFLRIYISLMRTTFL